KGLFMGQNNLHLQSDYHLIFLPGWATDSSIWLPLWSFLEEEKNVTLTGIDYSWNQSIHEWKQLVIDLLQKQGDASQILVGWSMGAALAIEVYLQHPHLVGGLVLISFNPHFCHQNRLYGWPRSILTKMKESLQRNKEETLKRFYYQLFDETEIDFADPFVQDWSLRIPHYELSGLLAGLDYLSSYHFGSILSSLTIPWIWIHGKNDKICPATVTSLYSGYPNIFILPRCGHIPHWTRTQDVVHHIKAFLTYVSS
ncbi:MAG: alpha/beta hydrolase, partial [Candidatus Bathyarchaeia archaeon]